MRGSGVTTEQLREAVARCRDGKRTIFVVGNRSMKIYCLRILADVFHLKVDINRTSAHDGGAGSIHLRAIDQDPDQDRGRGAIVRFDHAAGFNAPARHLGRWEEFARIEERNL